MPPNASLWQTDEMKPEIAVLVSSYQRPFHLERVLASLQCQRGVEGRFEIVVTDDGSEDETADVVEQFARRVSIPVRMTTHAHDGFQLARCRNEGVVASSADYLLFLDGDCLVPPDHLWQHFRRRRSDQVMAGYCCLLDRSTSEQLSVADVNAGRFVQAATPEEHKKLKRMDRKARWYEWLRHPTKPKLFGGNVGIWRTDYERINGYDENFIGWGCEDDDLRLRLRAAGKRIRSILRWTCTYHLWHPVGETTPSEWCHGLNVSYLRRRQRNTFCLNGIDKYRDVPSSVVCQVWNAPEEPQGRTIGASAAAVGACSAVAR